MRHEQNYSISEWRPLADILGLSLSWPIPAILFYSILGCVLPLQEVVLRKSPPSFSVLCCPCPYRSLLPHNVISPTTFWSSDSSYTLYLSFCASIRSSVIFYSGDVSSTFPFCILLCFFSEHTFTLLFVSSFLKHIDKLLYFPSMSSLQPFTVSAL